MVKVVHVISDTGIGGAGRLLYNLLSFADKSAFDIAAVLPHGSLLVPRLRALGIRTVEIGHGADRSADPLAIPALCRFLRTEKPHILHTHSALYARLAGRFCRVPAMINTRHCADMEETRLPLPKRLAIGGLERTLGCHTIATADYVKDVLTARGIPSKKITVIHNGSRALPVLSEQQKNATRQELGLSPSDFIVGMVARLEEGKGHETFLHAAKLCIQQNENIRFLIVGGGSRETSLRALAAELGVSDRVTFTGFLSEVAPIMNILDINVNCSRRSETSSLSLSEGMSVGAVPVVSDCGGNPYMAGFGENGILFPIDDAAALSKALLSLEGDRARLSVLSEKCRKRFDADFTAEAMTRRVESLYKEILKNTHASTDKRAPRH